MFKIDKEFKVHFSRGDTGIIKIKIPFMDTNGFIKYENGDGDVYWYDVANKKLYDEDYEESSVALDTLTLQYYQFQQEDVITFNVYKKKGYDKEPVLSKSVSAASPEETIIEFTEEDTTFGEISNKPITYWYDVTLNDDLTIVCYDENGAKEMIQYPAKGVDE